MDHLMRIAANFFLYGALGWVALTLVHTVRTGRFVSAGFLFGPVCPSIGLSTVILIELSPLITSRPPLVFLMATALSALLSVAGGWILRALFRIQWRGSEQTGLRRAVIRLLKAVAAGVLGTFFVFIVQPWIGPVIAGISPQLLGLLTVTMGGVLLLDSLYSLDVLDKVLLRLKGLHTELESFAGLYALQDEAELPALRRDIGWIRRLGEEGGLKPREAEALERIDALTVVSRSGYRLVTALPQLKPMGLEDELTILRAEWNRRTRIERGWLYRWVTRIRKRFTSTVKEMNPFAQGVGFYKLVWVFAVACVLGYLIETLFALVMRGVIESRQGMVYGPFNQVYGFGAVLMVVLLHPLAKKSDRWLFLGGALLGGAYEFLCSWVQEMVYGTVSWDYSQDATSIGGRTNLVLMLWWGVLGVVFIKGIYPHLSNFIERIPRRPGVVLSWVVAVLLVVNMALSAAAVGRWVLRQEGEPPRSAVGAFLDEQFPNDMMERIYPSMRVVEKPAAE